MISPQRYLPLLLCIYTFLFPAAIGFSQSLEPEEPDIVLPPLLLEVEDVSEESVSAALPQGDEYLLPQISVPLPDIEDITFGGSELAQATFPDQPPTIVGISPDSKVGSTFFTEGMIGGGTMSHIAGDISLYKIGSLPSFSIRYSHENLDGYGFRKPGSGFKNREDTVEGTLSFDTDTVISETEAYYTDAENGLQQNSDYESVTHRFYSVASDFVYTAPKIVKLYADVDVFGVNMVLSADDPASQAEFNIVPDFALGFVFPALEFGIRGEYAFRTYFDDYDAIHSAGATAYVDAELPLAIDLSVTGGFSWSSASGFAFPFPFDISVRGMIKSFFLYGISGGYRIEPSTYSRIWEAHPFLGYSGPLSDTESWFVEGNFEFLLLDSLSLDFGAEFRAVTGEVTPATIMDSGTGLYGVTGVDDVYHLYLTAGVSYDPGRIFSGSLSWRGQVLRDEDPLASEHSIGLSINLQAPNDRVGGGISALFPFDPGFIVPEVSASGFVKITEGVALWLEAFDVFAPLIEGGRVDWGDYEDPGFHFAVKLKISL